MDPLKLKIGIREFRAKLSTFVLENEVPIEITRHGDTVGYFIPVRRRRTAAERQTFREAAERLESILSAQGVEEDELVEEFKRLRAENRE